ncbi:MAG: alpha/beta hydrolase [Chloroflexi bacterium]|nr:alpha/beta hydrolase [Chloroflexota bacterium]
MTVSPTDRLLDLGSIRLFCRDWGGRGQPIVLLHGLASSSYIWDLMAPLLVERFRVVALDQRGHGRSERPDHDFGFATYVDDLTRTLDSLGFEQAVVVGHSWGGNVATQFAADRPDRTAGAVLVDGGFLELSARPGWTWERVEQDLAPPVLDGLTWEGFVARVRNGDLGGVWSPRVEQASRGHFEQLSDGTIRPWLRRPHHMRILRAMWEQRPSQLWERIEAPVLLFPCRRSNPQGRQAELQATKEQAVHVAASRLRRATTVWLEETIHDAPLQRPVDLAATIGHHFGASASDPSQQ